MNTGDKVKFRDPQTEDEKFERFTIVELRGERVLVTCDQTAHMSIQPTFVYLASDLVAA